MYLSTSPVSWTALSQRFRGVPMSLALCRVIVTQCNDHRDYGREDERMVRGAGRGDVGGRGGGV